MSIFHICRFSKPIVSQYLTFNQRNIVFECGCGKRQIRKVYKPFHLPFPIETSVGITSAELEAIASRNGHEELEQLYLQLLQK